MTRKSAIKSISIALGCAGGAIAFPALAPYLAASGAGQLLAGLLEDANLRNKLADVVPNTISGILTNLASDKFPEIAGSLTPDNNHDLEKALAEAFSRALDDIAQSAARHQPESERSDLQSEINRCLPYWQDRIKRGVRSPGSLFPAAHAAESFILASGDLEQSEDLLRNDVVATLQRWLREEEEHKGHSGSTGEFFNPLLPLVRERMPGLIGKHLNQIVKEDAYKNSWIAFQRAHLQSSLAVLRNVEAQNAGIASEVAALSERIDSITGNEVRLTELAGAIAELLGLLQEGEARREDRLIQLSNQILGAEERITEKVDETGREVIGKVDESTQKILEAVSGRISAAPNLHQLPADTSEFTGRADELDELLIRVKTSGVTITGLKGMGGIGKTWLAVRLAHELQNDYPEAQIYLDLQGVSRPDDRTGLRRQPLSPEDVMWHVIRSFHPGIERPESFEEHLTLYRECLNGRRVLLVYDNARDEDQIRPLHPPSSCLLIVTSRQSIDLPGMYLKQIDRMKPEESIELIERIAPGRSGDLAGEIATLCGHLPLALNVTASVLKKERMMKPADIVERLRKPSGRLSWKSLQEVETAFSLSYDLLSEDLQLKWRMLAVFSETFDKSAAAAIWDADPDLAAESCSELVDGYSLVEFDEKNARMRLHDLARDFAIDRITDDELSLARSRHSRHYLSVLSAADDNSEGGGENVLSGLNLYDAEARNILEGYDWAVGGAVEDSERARLAIDYPGRGINIISLRLHSSTLVEWHQAAVDAAVRINSKSDEGIARGNLGNAYLDLGEVRKAIENHEAALVIAREIGDRRGEGADLGNLGLAYADLGEVRKAIENYEAALVIAREIGDRRNEGAWLGNLGLAYAALGEVRKAIENHEAALVIAREIGDRRGEGADLGNLGLAYADLGEVRKAIENYEAALVIAREIGDRRNEGAWLGNLGLAYAALGEVRKAIENYEAALVIAREIGDRRGEGNHLGNLGNAYLDLGEVRKAIENYEAALVIAREIGDRRNEGALLGNLGLAYADLGEVRKAIENHEAALVISREIGDRRNEGNWLGNLGNAYADLGEVRKAIENYEAALVIAREIGDRRGEFGWLGNLHKANLKLWKFRVAYKYLMEAVETFKLIAEKDGFESIMRFLVSQRNRNKRKS